MVAIYRTSMLLLAMAMFFFSSLSPFITTVLALDNSGSMKRNDPQGLRFTAVELVAALLDESDQMGVVLFSTDSSQLTDGLISPSSFAGIQAVEPTGFTDIKAALVEAGAMLRNANPGNQRGIILTSDGKPEIARPYPEYEQETLLAAQNLGVPIYAIALSDQADIPFLKRLARQTGGRVFYAKDASDLLDAYLAAFGAIQDRTILGQGSLTAPGKAVIELDESLSPYIEKVSFVLAKTEQVSVSLLAPDGQEVLPGFFDARIIENERFLVVTIDQPPGGEWVFDVAGRGKFQARAILYSRLRAEIIMSSGFHRAGEPMAVTARLIEERENGEQIRVIGDVSFSALISLPNGSQVSLDRFYDDGTHGDKTAGDGDFTRLLMDTSQIGYYRLDLKGWKGAVAVEQSAGVDVVPFPELRIGLPESQHEIGGKPIILRATITGGDLSNLHGGQVYARITAPSGKIHEILLSGAQGEYAGEFWPDESGPHTLTVETRKMTYLGLSFWEVDQGQFDTKITRSVSLGKADTQIVTSCQGGLERVAIQFSANSLREEQISAALTDLPGFVVRPDAWSLAEGEQQVSLEILPSGKSPPAGLYRGALFFYGNSGTTIIPQSIPLEIAIPSFWSRCREPILSWGMVGGMAILIGLTIGLRLRKKATPPAVTGTLRCWAEGGHASEYDLTAYGKPSLVIGKNKECDLAFPESDLAERHIILSAEKGESDVVIVLEPLAAVKKKYLMVRARFNLVHGDEFSMGGLNFCYLSDSGE